MEENHNTCHTFWDLTDSLDFLAEDGREVVTQILSERTRPRTHEMKRFPKTSLHVLRNLSSIYYLIPHTNSNTSLGWLFGGNSSNFFLNPFAKYENCHCMNAGITVPSLCQSSVKVDKQLRSPLRDFKPRLFPRLRRL